MNLKTVVHRIEEGNPKVSRLQKLYWNFCMSVFGVMSLKNLIPYSWRDFYYNHIKIIFAPYHTRIRKTIPKRWADLTEIIVDVNFEIIKSFYEDEMLEGHVDWDATPDHKKFKKWIEKVYLYITTERPLLQDQKDKAYPETNLVRKVSYDESGNKITQLLFSDSKKTYEELYGEVDRLEQLIDKKDTQYITEMVKFRKHFWT